MKRKLGPATARQRVVRGATERQGEYLAAIAALTAELGHPPSAVAIAERLGVSRTGVRNQLAALEHKGLVRDVPKEVSSGQWGLTRAALEALDWPKAKRV